ncbi:hypothetical protein ACG1VR_04440 [Cedecea davisae]|uniref:hypothetical protein n=1 Tax=Cedecea davisae TaxID=158484 RepID=UPI00376EC851
MMKMPTGKLLALLLLPVPVLISGCQSPGKSLSGKGAADLQQVQCESDMRFIAADLPAQLYQRMNNCIKSREWGDATFLYALAGSKTWYDARRVDSQYAHARHSRLLKESIDSLSGQQKKAFWDNVQLKMNDGQKRDELCQRVKEAGTPEYRPDYMFIDPFNAADFNFSNRVSWEQAVNRYLEC